MPDDETTTAETTETTTETVKEETTEEQRVPLERFQKVNQQAKEAKDKAAKLERDLAEIRKQLDDREQAGLPELDQAKRRLEQAEKRAEEAEKRAEQTAAEAVKAGKARIVASTAAKLNFHDPDDAALYVDLEDIDDADAAERALKRVARSKPHLVKSDEDKGPGIGRVLESGKSTTPSGGQPGDIDLEAEARQLSNELQKLVRR